MSMRGLADVIVDDPDTENLIRAEEAKWDNQTKRSSRELGMKRKKMKDYGLQVLLALRTIGTSEETPPATLEIASTESSIKLRRSAPGYLNKRNSILDFREQMEQELAKSGNNDDNKQAPLEDGETMTETDTNENEASTTRSSEEQLSSIHQQVMSAIKDTKKYKHLILKRNATAMNLQTQTRKSLDSAIVEASVTGSHPSLLATSPDRAVTLTRGMRRATTTRNLVIPKENELIDARKKLRWSPSSALLSGNREQLRLMRRPSLADLEAGRQMLKRDPSNRILFTDPELRKKLLENRPSSNDLLSGKQKLRSTPSSASLLLQPQRPLSPAQQVLITNDPSSSPVAARRLSSSSSSPPPIIPRKLSSASSPPILQQLDSPVASVKEATNENQVNEMSDLNSEQEEFDTEDEEGEEEGEDEEQDDSDEEIEEDINFDMIDELKDEREQIKLLIKWLERERDYATRLTEKLEDEQQEVVKHRELMESVYKQAAAYQDVTQTEKESQEKKLEDVVAEITEQKQKNEELEKEIKRTSRSTVMSKMEFAEMSKAHEEILIQEKQGVARYNDEQTQIMLSVNQNLEQLETKNEEYKNAEETLLREVERQLSEHDKTKKQLQEQIEINETAQSQLEHYTLSNEALDTQITNAVLIQSPNTSPILHGQLLYDPVASQSVSSGLYFQQHVTPAIPPLLPVLSQSSPSLATPYNNNALASPRTAFIPISPRPGVVVGAAQSQQPPGTLELYQLVRKCDPVHSSSVKCMLVVENKLWVGCGDGVIRIWELQTGQMLEDRKHHTAGVLDMKWIKGQVWSTGKDCIYLWNVKKQAPVRKVTWDKKDCYCECLTEVDDLVWGGFIDGTVRVWNQKGKLKKLIKHGQIVASMLRRGTLVWLGTEGPIILCRVDTFESTMKLTAHTQSVNVIQSVGPFEIWSASSDKTIKIWNDLGECLQVLECGSKVFSLLEVDNFVWAGCWEPIIYVYHYHTHELLQKIKSDHVDATSAFATDQQKQVWSGSWDKTICIWRKSRQPQLSFIQ